MSLIIISPVLPAPRIIVRFPFLVKFPFRNTSRYILFEIRMPAIRHREIIPSTKNILFGRLVIGMEGKNGLGKLKATRKNSEKIKASTMFSRSLILTYRHDIPYTLNTASVWYV